MYMHICICEIPGHVSEPCGVPGLLFKADYSKWS